MKRLFTRFLSGSNAAREDAVVFDAPRVPGRTFAVVGDVHGRADLLEEIGALLGDLPQGAPVIFVGDYIDRGEQSREVLEILSGPDLGREREIVCLMGNHEAMCLAFLDDPISAGQSWIRYGGLQTLASFGVSGVGSGGDSAALVRARDRLALAMGDRLIEWMRALPLMWQSGNIGVVHAAADPSRAMKDQPGDTLLWGHPEFRRRNRADGQWVIHGHTIVDQPTVEGGRISIDTGAYATGKLTAVILSEGDLIFRQTGK